jgi:hypothetical protein
MQMRRKISSYKNGILFHQKNKRYNDEYLHAFDLIN